MKNLEIISPLTNGNDVTTVQEFKSSNIIAKYNDELGVDVKEYFKDIDLINLFKCNVTNYRFYYPFNLAGDDKFYQELQKFEWYYMPWKWEHDATIKYFQTNDKILEVGSGGLGFIERIQSLKFDITGLELNEDSISRANVLGLRLFNTTIQDFAKNQKENFDVVCSYQVLEHISNVNSFLKSQLDCLKCGGKLIISVPNNDSFIKISNGGILNFPPHHMGLWNRKSLSKLVEIFNLKLIKIEYEPLQPYHVEQYVESKITKYINRNKLLKIIFRKLKLKIFLVFATQRLRKYLIGHSILAVYEKSGP